MKFLYKGKEISEAEIDLLGYTERGQVQREEDNGARWRPWRAQGDSRQLQGNSYSLPRAERQKIS